MSAIWPRSPSSLSAEQIDAVYSEIEPALIECADRLKLTVSALPVKAIYIPLANTLQLKARHANSPLVVGINGSQGSGKSTLSTLLALVLEHGFKLNATSFSIDDIYKTHAERQTLGETVHPLLKTRGVPGTHDIPLGVDTIHALKTATEKDSVAIPQFTKAVDDRAPVDSWPQAQGPVHVAIFEGWCVGALAQDESELDQAINDLERDEDSDGTWRRYANQQLKENYGDLFSKLDILIMLKAPAMESVFNWRKMQEDKLRASIVANGQDGPDRTMDDKQLARFIQHYERLTRHMLNEMPQRADITLMLDDDHVIHTINTKD